MFNILYLFFSLWNIRSSADYKLWCDQSVDSMNTVMLLLVRLLSVLQHTYPHTHYYGTITYFGNHFLSNNIHLLGYGIIRCTPVTTCTCLIWCKKGTQRQETRPFRITDIIMNCFLKQKLIDLRIWTYLRPLSTERLSHSWSYLHINWL